MKEINWSDVKVGRSVKVEVAGRLRTIKKMNADYGEITFDARYPKTVGLNFYPTYVPGKMYEIPPKPPKAKKASAPAPAKKRPVPKKAAPAKKPARKKAKSK